jgi:hypothetical protein
MTTEHTTTPDPAPEGRMEDRWALDDLAELVGFRRDAHPAEVVRAVRAELARVRPVVDAAGDSPAGDLIGRNDDWWNGYRAGAETSHSRDCTAAATERDHLREELERCQVVCEQRIADLQAEFARQFKVAERQRDQARAALAATTGAVSR